MSIQIPDHVVNVDWPTMMADVEQQLRQFVWLGLYGYELCLYEPYGLYGAGGALRHVFGADEKELNLLHLAERGVNHVYPEDVPVWLQFLQSERESLTALKARQRQKTVYFRQLTLDGRQMQVMHLRKPVFMNDGLYPAAMLCITVDVSHLRPANAPASITSLDMTDVTHPVFTIHPNEPKSQEPLTFRELSILELLADGKTSKQAAYSLNISPNTIDTHRRRILMKTNTSSITEAVAKAIRNGWFVKIRSLSDTIYQVS
ncbi:helix-turn-helix transcriptional regulator [Arsenicibacter rosenii]|uniref:HTH luxR-type domain-containing protein n=1 Tax=Arsenicibacter rosenii TaxID=1750698 RepID=A0A1S2VJ11_9BACT|nr:helix-turn-helix transcriptional regulator [Arsenicibacter rosenii]OIN58744.1 hypothetical protein BLX24_14415 [Arsenicibacter rosenii]